jgi:hypothetical protein
VNGGQQKSVAESDVVKGMQRARAQQMKQKLAAAEPKPGVSYQLPLWPDLERAMPHVIARSSLFGVVARGRRRLFGRESISSRSDAQLFFSGEQLDQSDADVWMQILECASEAKTALEDRVYFNRSNLLSALGRSAGKGDYEWLARSIRRLTAATLEIETARYVAVFHLIERFEHDKEKGSYYVTLNPRSRMLFENNTYGFIDWNARQKIEKQRDLSKWLQSYASSHKAGEIHRAMIASLKKLSGCEEARERDFRASLTSALGELVRVGVIQRVKFNQEGSAVSWYRTANKARIKQRAIEMSGAPL